LDGLDPGLILGGVTVSEKVIKWWDSGGQRPTILGKAGKRGGGSEDEVIASLGGYAAYAETKNSEVKKRRVREDCCLCGNKQDN